MNADVSPLDFVYVGVMLGSMVLLATFWNLLPGLLREEITRNDVPTDDPLRSARASGSHVGHVLPQP